MMITLMQQQQLMIKRREMIQRRKELVSNSKNLSPNLWNRYSNRRRRKMIQLQMQNNHRISLIRNISSNSRRRINNHYLLPLPLYLPTNHKLPTILIMDRVNQLLSCILPRNHPLVTQLQRGSVMVHHHHLSNPTVNHYQYMNFTTHQSYFQRHHMPPR